jgi:hypothetical protein
MGAPRTSSFALQAFDNRSRIVVTATATVTIPAALVLGPDFECIILAQGATVTIDGPGATNITLAPNQFSRIWSSNGVVYAGTATPMNLI